MQAKDEQFAWCPGGSLIVFVSPDEPPNNAEIERHYDLFEVGNHSFLAASAPTPSHIWLVSASGGTGRRVTTGGSPPALEPVEDRTNIRRAHHQLFRDLPRAQGQRNHCEVHRHSRGRC